MEKKMDDFNVIVLGIIFNPKIKKILIGKRENDPYVPKLTWGFPGGRVSIGDDLEKTIKEKIRGKTGLKTESLGIVFAKTYLEKKNLLSIYFLCEKISGKEKANDEFKEIKWVSPKELKKYFTTSFHPKLQEYVEGLVH